MNSETKLPPAEELWEMVKTFSQHADNLIRLLEAERQKSEELDTENAGSLKIYRSLQSEIVALKAEKSRLESWIRAHQDDPRSERESPKLP